MPDPRDLKVGDRVRFTELPSEWSSEGYFVDKDDVHFMEQLIERTRPSGVTEIDENGYPWIVVHMRTDHRLVYHKWMIAESTGWRKVVPRRKPD